RFTPLSVQPPKSPRSEGGVEPVEALIESADGAGAVLSAACGAAQGCGQAPVRLLEDELGERPGPVPSGSRSAWRRTSERRRGVAGELEGDLL
ncbi:hypothetical protein, partial [Streptomyces rutgersensis]|uniref:hypothetical protein n=1 Tax=Streptomyces rutgersensis TaxID=53451 RepID=UPI001C1162ED